MYNVAPFLQQALSFFLHSVSTKVVVYTAIGGVDVPTVSSSLSIQAAVEPSNSQNMERIFGGSISDGDIGVITESVLYLDDAHSAGTTRRQTFVSYGGLWYRVTRKAEWTPHAGFCVYLASRYLDQEGIL